MKRHDHRHELLLLEPRTLYSMDPALVGVWATTPASPVILADDSPAFAQVERPLMGPAYPILQPSFNAALASGPSWVSLIGLDQLRADSRFAGIDGTGFTSAILDSGADLDHPFFGPDANSNGVADRIVYQHDYADNDSDASGASDHGSNVASIVGSQDSYYRGVAPAVDLAILKVFTNAGAGNFGMVERALQWVVANHATFHISSVNLSLGDNQNHATAQQLYGIADELEYLASHSVKVIASAGNAFYSFSSTPGAAYPAADPNVIGVGAVFAADLGTFRASGGATAYVSGPDVVAPFSQRSQALTPIFGPGVAIAGAGLNGTTVAMSGTSQAAPIIAGLAVLADQIASGALGRVLTTQEFRSILTSSGVSITDGDDEDDNVDNTGARFTRVDAMALAEAVLAMGTPSPQNRAPTLTTIASFARAIPGRPYVVTYERLLGASDAGDLDADPITFRIEQVMSGSLTFQGQSVIPGVTTVGPGDSLIWKPASVRTGSQSAFSVVAFDGLAASAGPVGVTIIAGPTVFGLTTRIERDNRGKPAPTYSGGAASGPRVGWAVWGAAGEADRVERAAGWGRRGVR